MCVNLYDKRILDSVVRYISIWLIVYDIVLTQCHEITWKLYGNKPEYKLSIFSVHKLTAKLFFFQMLYLFDILSIYKW